VEGKMARARSEVKIIRTGSGETLILEYGKLNALEERIKALEGRIEVLEKGAKAPLGRGGRRPEASRAKVAKSTTGARRSTGRASRRK
jgi:hypothetical protein